MRNSRHLFRAIAFFLLLGLLPSRAVIVGGVNGNGSNNTGESNLQSFLSTASLPLFPYWDNLLRVSDASGIYLGYNASTGRGWVMTAAHVTGVTSLAVGGTSYTVRDNQVVGSLDVRLYAIGGNTGDPSLPDMSAVSFSTVSAGVGDTVVMAGRGMRLNQGNIGEDTTAPYSWGTPGTNDANPVRWGSNTVEDVGLTVNGDTYWSTDFDVPGSSTDYDAQASLGDSGGSGFILQGGQWWLAGLMTNVDDGPDADALVNPAGYGEITYFVDTQVYRTDIQAITGTLIPEPSGAVLLAGALALAIVRRRRDSSGRLP